MNTITITPPTGISLENALSILKSLNFKIVNTYIETAKKRTEEQESECVSTLIEEARSEFKEYQTTKINPLDIWKNLSRTY